MPKKPSIAYVDGDLIVFPCASSAQSTKYVYKDIYDRVVATFDSAKAGKNWLDEIEIMGVDVRHGFRGDPSTLIRESIVEVGELKTATSNYKSIHKRWLRDADVEDHRTYVAKKSGLPVFRHELCLRKPYKGNRGGEKPFHLEELRKWALTQPNHKRTTGAFETDDVVCGLAQRKGESAVLVSPDKDSLQVSGCWVYMVDHHDKPVFSDPKILGEVYMDKGKCYGIGHLFLLAQILMGDSADNYSGCDKVGPVAAHDILSPFNKKSVSKLEDVIKASVEPYKQRYGNEYEYTNKDGKPAVASWRDFYEESLQLAYMRKSKTDTPAFILDIVNDIWEKEQ